MFKKRENAIPTEDKLSKMDFNIDKSIKNNAILKEGFIALYVDDTKDKVAIELSGKPLSIYDYGDIISFELIEDGDIITQGKGIATVVGGLTFGLTGAMVGQAGKRSNQKNCTSLNIRININNLNDPIVLIPLIQRTTKKNSLAYQAWSEIAQDIIGTLTYIENKKDMKDK